MFVLRFNDEPSLNTHNREFHIVLGDNKKFGYVLEKVKSSKRYSRKIQQVPFHQDQITQSTSALSVETSVLSETPGVSSLFSETSEKSTLSLKTFGKSSLPLETPRDSPLSSKTPGESPLPLETPRDSTLPSNTFEKSSLPSKTPGESTLLSGTPGESSLPSGTPGEASLSSGTPGKSFLPIGTPGDSSFHSKTFEEPKTSGGSTLGELMNDELPFTDMLESNKPLERTRKRRSTKEMNKSKQTPPHGELLEQVAPFINVRKSSKSNTARTNRRSSTTEKFNSESLNL